MLVLPDTEEVFVPFPVGEREEGSRIFVEPEKSRFVSSFVLLIYAMSIQYHCIPLDFGLMRTGL